MAAIYKRELKSYFQCMTGYVFIAFLVLFVGIYFMAYNLMSGYPYFSYTLSGMVTIVMIGIPVLTMRSFADDRKTKTDQLLLTAPVSVPKMVLAKYLSMVTVFAVPVLISCLCPLIIKMNGTAYLKADYASILAFSSGLCLHCHWNVYIIHDREPDYRGSGNLRSHFAAAFMAQPRELPSDLGLRFAGGLPVSLDTVRGGPSSGNEP